VGEWKSRTEGEQHHSPTLGSNHHKGSTLTRYIGGQRPKVLAAHPPRAPLSPRNPTRRTTTVIPGTQPQSALSERKREKALPPPHFSPYNPPLPRGATPPPGVWVPFPPHRQGESNVSPTPTAPMVWLTTVGLYTIPLYHPCTRPPSRSASSCSSPRAWLFISFARHCDAEKRNAGRRARTTENDATEAPSNARRHEVPLPASQFEN